MAFLSLTIKMNLLLATSTFIVLSLRKLSTFRTFKISYLYQLQISYLLVVLSLVLPAAFRILNVQVASNNSPLASTVHTRASDWSISIVRTIRMFETVPPQVYLYLSYLVASLTLLGIMTFLVQIYILSKKSKTFTSFKKINNLYIVVKPDEASPYVYSTGFKRFIVLPHFIISDMQLLRISVKHELQHIRQHDTSWVYLLNFVLLAFYANPLVHLLILKIKNMQELACDEELVLNKKVKFKSYIQALLKIAELVHERKSAPFFANTILREDNKSNLRERVETMIKVRKNMNKGYIAGILLFVSIIAMGCSSYAIKDMQASERVEKTAVSVMLEMIVTENGKIVSRPKVISVSGEDAEIVQQDYKGNEISMIIRAVVSGTEVRMEFQRRALEQGVVVVAESFTATTQNKVTWTHEMQQGGKTHGLSVTPTIIAN